MQLNPLVSGRLKNNIVLFVELFISGDNLRNLDIGGSLIHVLPLNLDFITQNYLLIFKPSFPVERRRIKIGWDVYVPTPASEGVGSGVVSRIGMEIKKKIFFLYYPSFNLHPSTLVMPRHIVKPIACIASDFFGQSYCSTFTSWTSINFIDSNHNYPTYLMRKLLPTARSAPGRRPPFNYLTFQKQLHLLLLHVLQNNQVIYSTHS